MPELVSVLAPYGIALLVGIPLGMLIQKKAPGARWVYPGVMIAVLSVVQTDYALWMRAITFVIGVALITWEYRRRRIRKAE